MSERRQKWPVGRYLMPLLLVAGCSSETPTKQMTPPLFGTAGNGSLPATGTSGTTATPSTTAGVGIATAGVGIATSGRSGSIPTAGTFAPQAGSSGPIATAGRGMPPSAAGSTAMAAGTGATPPAAGTAAPPAAGSDATPAAGSGAMAGTGAPPVSMAGSCTPAPMGAAISDYGAKGPFDAMEVDNTGPGGQFTMFRPRTLGMNGFLHPPVTWGNGVTTVPQLYTALLNTVASHGFVVIASNSQGVTAQDVRQGLEWLIQQNDAAGDFQGKLAVKCAGAIGYSMGGGAAVTAAAHPNVIATVSMHGLPGAAGMLNGPLLLMTSTNDGFVTKEGFVQPCYDASTKVPTIMATENVPGTPDFTGHLLPLGDAGNERAPLIAWLRLFIYGDQGGRDWFYGSDCRLCKAPWTDIKRKNGMWD